jgi:hypothetical protein
MYCQKIWRGTRFTRITPSCDNKIKTDLRAVGFVPIIFCKLSLHRTSRRCRFSYHVINSSENQEGKVWRGKKWLSILWHAGALRKRIGKYVSAEIQFLNTNHRWAFNKPIHEYGTGSCRLLENSSLLWKQQACPWVRKMEIVDSWKSKSCSEINACFCESEILETNLVQRFPCKQTCTKCFRGCKQATSTFSEYS